MKRLNQIYAARTCAYWYTLDADTMLMMQIDHHEALSYGDLWAAIYGAMR